WIGLLIVGTPLALALAIIAALLSFVPILGPIISAIPAVLVAMVQSPLDVVWVIVVYSVVQFLEGNFITPLIEQRAVSIPPLIVLSAQLAAGALVGSIGIIFATPMAAAAAVVAEEIYIRDILGDRGQSFSD
ncbi:MAG TPA: AI-2E family transporter, partial [Planctomycetota bacterium]|nr:AI-2E family transporter [Planctomycetota bacterium]